MHFPYFDSEQDAASAFWLGYAMGLIAGEGNFAYATMPHYRRACALRVKLVAADPEPLNDLQRLFGGRQFYRPTIRGNRQPLREWVLSSGELRDAIPVLYRYLPPSRKREQLLEWYPTHWSYRTLQSNALGCHYLQQRPLSLEWHTD